MFGLIIEPMIDKNSGACGLWTIQNHTLNVTYSVLWFKYSETLKVDNYCPLIQNQGQWFPLPPPPSPPQMLACLNMLCVINA